MSGLVELYIFRIEDGCGKECFFVPPEEVPAWLKEPEKIDFLMSGCVAQAPGETDIYFATRTGAAVEHNPLVKSLLVNEHGQPIH